MGTYAADTNVDSTKSRMEIERTVARYGATSFAYGTDEQGTAVIAFKMRDRRVRFTLTLPPRSDFRLTETGRTRTASSRDAAYEQAVRQRWRALALVVKAKLEAVESGITEFEQEFGMFILMPDGRTVYEHTQPGIESAYLRGVHTPLLAIE